MCEGYRKREIEEKKTEKINKKETIITIIVYILLLYHGKSI